MIKAFLLLTLVLLSVHDVAFAFGSSHYINEWAAEILGGVEHARRVARDHGYELAQEVRYDFIVSVYCLSVITHNLI